MYLNEIVRELELSPNSLVKINDIKNFHNDLISLTDKSTQYLVYLENDYVEKTFSIIDNLTFARDFHEPFKVYVYGSLIGELDLKKQKLLLSQVQTNEEMFYTATSLMTSILNNEISDLEKSINVLRQAKQSINSKSFFDKLLFFLKKNDDKEVIFQQTIDKKEEKKKSLLLKLDSLNLMWKKCFDDRLLVIDKLKNHCLNNNIKVELGEINDIVSIDTIVDRYIAVIHTADLNISYPKLKTNHKGIKTME